MAADYDSLPYSKAEREIYKYRDGENDVFADPSVLWRNFRRAQRSEGIDYAELITEAKSIEKEISGVSSPDPTLVDRLDFIYEKICDLGRSVFEKQKLQPDGTGWTDLESISRLTHFLDWISDLQGKQETSPSGSDATAGPPEVSVDEVAKGLVTPIGMGSI